MSKLKESILGEVSSKNGFTTATGFIEKQYPETAKEFKRLQEEQYELLS